MNQARLLQYFEEELAYLASAGPRFARRHPERAALVSLDNVTSRDPDVERLVQAFAFLAGQVRAELRDELPQITHSLMSLLWPHYLRPVPSTAVVEFKPDFNQLESILTIPAGKASVESAPLTSPESGRDFTCRFRNALAIDLAPIKLTSADVVRLPTKSELVLRFEIGPAADPRLNWSKIRLHIAGDPIVALDLRYWLLYMTDTGAITAEAQFPDGAKTNAKLGTIKPVGLHADDALFDAGKLGLPGFRLVQEYFLAKHKFLYVDLTGLEKIGPIPPETKLTIKIPFTQPPTERIRFTTDTFKLHCAPVINLFNGAAIPIRYDGRKSHYPLFADHDTQAVALQRVLRVYGQAVGAKHLVDYPNFLEFRHSNGSDDPYYHLEVQAGVDGRPEWKLSLARPKGIIPPQVVSIDLECSNGELAAALMPGDIRYRGEGLPDLVEPKNITQPEPIYQPPIESAASWRFISHLSMNYLSLEDVDALVGVLKLYDWTPTSANWRRLQGIRSINARPGCTIVEGVALRGRDITVELDPSHFANLGDASLFSEVLSNFFALYAHINSYTRLEARLTTGQVFRFPALNGRQKPV